MMLPEEQRVMPVTRSDEETLSHPASCLCEVCQRPSAAALRARVRDADRKRAVREKG